MLTLTARTPLFMVPGRAWCPQGLWFGKPASCMMYDLAYYLQMNNSYMLWCGSCYGLCVCLGPRDVAFRVAGCRQHQQGGLLLLLVLVPQQPGQGVGTVLRLYVK